MSPINSDLEFWSVNRASMYENPKLYVFRNKKFVGEVTYYCPADLFVTNVYKTLKSC